MKFMLLMWGEWSDQPAGQAPAPDSPADGEAERCWLPWPREMQERGVELHDGAVLGPVTSGATVRVVGSKILVADGPFAETKEQVGGYDVIECASLDEAVAAAARHPVAVSGGIVEVRPITAT